MVILLVLVLFCFGLVHRQEPEEARQAGTQHRSVLCVFVCWLRNKTVLKLILSYIAGTYRHCVVNKTVW